MRFAQSKLKRILTGTTALVSVAGATGASAAEFRINDDISVTTNVTISAGVSFRTEDPSSEAIFSGNGARVGLAGDAASATQDDGTLNFEKGEVVSAPITVVADAEFNYRDDVGFFIRGKGVYDIALDNTDVNHGHAPNDYAAGQELTDSNFNTLARFATATILDAFVFGEVDAGEVPIELRVGRQVVSWGESTFIQNGINSINPIDVTAFRRPGVQLKEGLLPLGMIYANAGVTDNLSIEGFWNFEFQQTQLDGCGTFFSTADVAAQGCNELSLATVPAGSVDSVERPDRAGSGRDRCGTGRGRRRNRGCPSGPAWWFANTVGRNASRLRMMPGPRPQASSRHVVPIADRKTLTSTISDWPRGIMSIRSIPSSVCSSTVSTAVRRSSAIRQAQFLWMPGSGLTQNAATYNVEYVENVHTVGCQRGHQPVRTGCCWRAELSPGSPSADQHERSDCRIDLSRPDTCLLHAVNPADQLFAASQEARRLMVSSKPTRSAGRPRWWRSSTGCLARTG